MATCSNCGEDKITVEMITKGQMTCPACIKAKSNKTYKCAFCGLECKGHYKFNGVLKPACTGCWHKQKDSGVSTDPKLNARAKKLSDEFVAKRKAQDKQRSRKDIDHEEAYLGSCKNGCGNIADGSYICAVCRKEAEEKSFTLGVGETELWRGPIDLGAEGEGIKLTRQIVAISADSIAPERMGWVWIDRIPDAAVTWILGQPNNAKSLLTIEIAACASTGRDWPDGTPNTMGAVDVLMCCFEDSLSKQVVPRLMAAGADLKRIKFLDRRSFRTHLAGNPEPAKKGLDLTEHLPALLAALKAMPAVKLIIVDPIRDIFGKARMTHDPEVGPVLADLIEFCEKARIAFVGVVHVPKHQTNSAIEKVAGGSAVAASAKSAFMLSRDPDSDDKHHHVMTMVKWNYTGKTGGMKYSTVPATVDYKGETFEVAKITWGETTDIIADDVLKAQNAKPMERDKQADKCEAFLMTFLKDEPKRSPEVYEEALKFGFGSATVKRAMKNIGGYHLDRRAQRSGYWMSLTPDPMLEAVEPENQKMMAVADGQEL